MEFASKNNTEPKIYGIYKFFCWCSGARLYLLKKCPTDFNVFFGIGMIVFLTGVMAFLSGSYAFYTVFEDVYMAAAFGVFWGVLIFFFDWYLVASLRKEKRFFRELITASPRIILALFLAVVISRPIELKLFESEIEGQMDKMSQQKFNNYKDIVGESYDEILVLKKQNTKMESTINKLLIQRNDLFQLFVEEAEGRSPTGKLGKGPVYKEKKSEYNKINEIYEQEKSRFYPLIDANNKRIAEMSKLQANQLKSGNEKLERSTGFLARIEAYGQLAKENDGIKYTGWFILLMFMCIETGPMFVKLISRRGAYDELIGMEEMRIMAESQQKIVQIQQKTHRLIEIEKQKSITQLKEEIINNEDFVKYVMQAQSEIGVEKIKRWKQRELKRIDDNLDDYRPTINELIEEAKLVLKPN